VAVLRLRWLEKRSDEQRVRSHLLSQQLVAAQEEERKKLTRELHDHVGQMLTALRMELGRAQRVDPQANQVLAECKQLVDTILRSVRDLVMGLRPSMLDDFGLQPALEWHVRDFRRRANMRVELRISGDVAALPDQHRTCVYRIVQEALTNCARHAQAKRADISLRYEPGRIELVVTDDGIGLDPAKSRGMGLLGIEERVRELRGTFEVRTPQQGGTQLSIVLPVPPADEKEAELARAAG
jgi:signal transduction histidine kinase